jgi:hypothetical protein
MFKNIWIMFGMLLIFSGVAYAEEQYQPEIKGLYTRTDWEHVEARVISYGISGEWFFDPVRTDDHPYAEAAFLERTGSILVWLQSEEVQLPGFPIGKGPDGGVRFTFAKEGFPLVVQALYNGWRIHINGMNPSQFPKGDRLGISIGDYITNRLVVGIDYSHTRSDDFLVPALFPPFFGGSSISYYDYNLFSKYVHEMERGTGFTIQARIGQTRPEASGTLSSTNEALSIMYYFTRNLGAGIGFKNSAGKNVIPNGTDYQANIDYFISPSFSINASYDRFLASSSGSDLNNRKSFDIAAAVRF